MANGIELAKAYVQIIPSAEGIKSKITEEMGGDISQAGVDLGKVFGGKIASTLKKVLGAAAIGKTIAASINAGGALEQSLGGIETLFKDSAGIVQQNAAQAYKTAGLSANDYMEQTTSFAASLLSSLGNNTKAAAIVADMAMTDMADNANKMGTDMAAIQNAYQGFAKQNYTMLDNLKLGYGGTQAEMARLLADASKLSGQKYELGNLADMYNAIHVIQQELDITGTTAKEASTTLTGSFSAMGAAFQNVLGQLATGGELTSSLQALTETARTYLLDNLLPAVGNVVAGIPQVIATLAPNILQSGTELMQSLASGFTEGIPAFLASALPQVLQFTEELRANFGQFVSAGIDLILNLANGIVEGLPELFAYIPDIVTNIAGLINDNAPKLLAGGVALVVQLARGILESATLIPQNFGKIIESVLAVLSAVNWVNLGANILKGLANGLKSMSGAVTAAFKEGIVNGLKYLATLPIQLAQWGKNLLLSFIGGLTGKASIATAGIQINKTANSTVKVPHITAADEGIADKNEYNSMIMSNFTAASNAKALADAAKSSGTAAKAATTAAKKTAEDTKKLTSSLKDTTTEIVQGSGDIVGSIKRVTETANNLYDVYDGTTKKLKGTANETTKTITDTWTEIINGTEKTVKQVTTIAADGSKKVEKSVDNVTLSVTEMQSRIDKALSQAKSEWSDGIFGLFRGIVSDIKSKDWSGLALDFAKLLWGQVDQGQREIIAQWAANALSAVNDAYAGGGLSAAASSIKAIFSDGIAAGATEAGTAVQSFSTILEGLNASGGVGSALSGIASSFSGMASSVISSLSGIVSLVMGNPILAAILGITALAGGIALGSFLKKKSSSAASAVTSSTLSYKDIQDAYWYGNQRSFAGYDFMQDRYAMPSYQSGGKLTAYQEKMQASVDALYNVVQQYLPQAGNQVIKLDDGTLVGALAPSIDAQLGHLATLAERGN